MSNVFWKKTLTFTEKPPLLYEKSIVWRVVNHEGFLMFTWFFVDQMYLVSLKSPQFWTFFAVLNIFWKIKYLVYQPKINQVHLVLPMWLKARQIIDFWVQKTSVSVIVDIWVKKVWHANFSSDYQVR